MVDVGKLQVFLIAAETENFSSSTRRLGLSQPAISFRIQSLESELKVKLFERVGKRVVLTEVGRELLPMARELINLATSIEETVGAWRDTVQGPLYLGCGTNLAKHILPHLIGAFTDRYPQVQVNCEGVSHQAIREKLVKREIHFGIVSQRCKSTSFDSSLFFTDELVLVVDSSHLWAARGRILPDELREQDWILGSVPVTGEHTI